MKILLVSYYFAPMNTIAAVRLTKIAKYLHKCGHDVTVICGDISDTQLKIDDLLEKDIEENIKIYAIKISGITKWLDRKIQNVSNSKNVKSNISTIDNSSEDQASGLLTKIKMGLKPLIIDALNFFESFDWAMQCKKHLKHYHKNENYDAVISSAGPVGSHMVGYYLKKRNAKIWLADFRDPLDGLLIKTNIKRKVITYLQKKYINKANIVTTVSDGLRSYLEIFDNDKDKFHTVKNGFDPAEREDINNSNIFFDPHKLNFVYCGSMYGNKRDFKPLFDALSHLILKKRISIKDIALHYAGNSSSVVLEKLKTYGLDEILVDHGQITRKKSLQLQKAADIITVITWNNSDPVSKGVLPAKFFESFLVERQVLLLVNGREKDSELAQMVNSFEVGFAFEEAKSDIQSLINFIYSRKFEKLKNGKLEYKVSDLVYQWFSHGKIVNEINSLLVKYLTSKGIE